MAAKSKFREPRSQKTNLPIDIEERIRRRAFKLYEQRGRVDGLALDDWLPNFDIYLPNWLAEHNKVTSTQAANGATGWHRSDRAIKALKCVIVAEFFSKQQIASLVRRKQTHCAMQEAYC